MQKALGSNPETALTLPGAVTGLEGAIWQNIERGVLELFTTATAANTTGRVGAAEDVAVGVAFLASPVASRISGANLLSSTARSPRPCSEPLKGAGSRLSIDERDASAQSLTIRFAAGI